MDKGEKLKELHERMAADESLPLSANLVFGEGNPDGHVLFIGEAPGQKEDELVRPFVGRSGQLLTKWIEGLGWERADVYITNIVKRRPPENRDPLPEEIAAYTPYLKEQIDIINPRVIAPLGRFAMNYFIPTAKISKDQGRTFWWGERIVMPIFHPAAALRNPAVMKQTEETFLKLEGVVEKYDEFIEIKRKQKKEDTGDSFFESL